MNGLMVFLYFVCFALLVGTAFAMMWANIMSIRMGSRKPPAPKHPESPEAGEEVMFVDLSREKLEDLYRK